jgi:hypothetical protein
VFLKIFEKVCEKKQWFLIGFILDLEGLLLLQVAKQQPEGLQKKIIVPVVYHCFMLNPC